MAPEYGKWSETRGIRGRQDTHAVFPLDSTWGLKRAHGTIGTRASRGKDGGRTGAGSSLILQPAAELPPASLPSPAAGFEAEGPQLVLEGLVIHGPVVLGFTEVLGQDGRGPSI